MSGMKDPAAEPAFVDSIEAGIAKLLLRDDRGEWTAFQLPSSVLPKDIKEGMWLRLFVEKSMPPHGMETAPLRKTLSAKDDGGDFSL